MYDFYTVYVIGVIDFSTITFIKFLCAELEYFTDTLVFASMDSDAVSKLFRKKYKKQSGNVF